MSSAKINTCLDRGGEEKRGGMENVMEGMSGVFLWVRRCDTNEGENMGLFVCFLSKMAEPRCHRAKTDPS